MKTLLPLAALALFATLPAVPAAAEPEQPSPEEVLARLEQFFAKTARPDGSFRPGVDASYDGISDSAFSDLAPVTYAVVIHKTFGWKLPDEEKTRAFLLARQQDENVARFILGLIKDPEFADRSEDVQRALPAAMDPRTYYEVLFWGGGHVLQFTWTLLMLVAWLWLADAIGAQPPLSPRVVLVLFALALLLVLARIGG